MAPSNLQTSKKSEGPELRQWLWINMRIGALSFGSSGRALLFRDALVQDRTWLTDDEFQEVMTLTQVLPGPNLTNLSVYLGLRFTGVGGAVAGLLLLTLPGALMLVALFILLGFSHPGFNIFFNGVSIGSITLFMLLVWRLIKGLSPLPRVERPLANAKLICRLTVAAVVAAFSLLQPSIMITLLAGAGLGLAVEFLV